MTPSSFFHEWAMFFEIGLIHKFRKEKKLHKITEFIKQDIKRFNSICDRQDDPLNTRTFDVPNGVAYLRMLKEIDFTDASIESVRSKKIEQLSMFYNYEQNDYVIILCDHNNNELGNWVISIGDDLEPKLTAEFDM